MGKKPEARFRDTCIRPFLKNIGARFFIKEALAIRGIPDIIGCINGKHFELEVKARKEEVARGRLALQVHNLTDAINHGGFGMVVYPENFQLFVDLFREFSIHGVKDTESMKLLLPRHLGTLEDDA
jgi:hypothetical protein